MDGTERDAASPGTDVRAMVKEVIQEFMHQEHSKAEPVYKAELIEERKRREQLEARINLLVEENRRSRMMAEELDRAAAIRAELQKLGVSKIDLAFKAVKDDIIRQEDGRLVAPTERGELEVRDYLARFVNENPELLPARISGGSGVGAGRLALPLSETAPDLDKIRPGMSAEERERIRQEISRIASQSTRPE